MVNNDGAALHVGAVVDALHGVEGAGREAAKATTLRGKLGNVWEADVFDTNAAVFHVGELAHVSVGLPTIRGYINRCGAGRLKGKMGSVSEADGVKADNAALHVVETACVAVGAPTIIFVKGHPDVNVVNVGWAFW